MWAPAHSLACPSPAQSLSKPKPRVLMNTKTVSTPKNIEMPNAITIRMKDAPRRVPPSPQLLLVAKDSQHAQQARPVIMATAMSSTETIPVHFDSAPDATSRAIAPITVKVRKTMMSTRVALSSVLQPEPSPTTSALSTHVLKSFISVHVCHMPIRSSACAIPFVPGRTRLSRRLHSGMQQATSAKMAVMKRNTTMVTSTNLNAIVG
mmetsp:Transcript_133314/g.231266  ORF Transcript_133314/g.231266 Transcript_133314/m.231266 type:complete len:207 (+) Transcript_133314:772-1392(+)